MGGVFNTVNLHLYHYAGNNPVKYTDPDGNWIETGWDVTSLAAGIYSFVNNVKNGDVLGAVIDGAGIIADAAAVALPLIPGGAGTAIKAVRATKATAETLVAAGQIYSGATNIKEGFEKGNDIQLAAGLVQTASGSGKLAKSLKTLGNMQKASNFFEGTSYSNKVLEQMENAPGEYHAFPDKVENFSGDGIVENIKGGDGNLYTKLIIPGSYNGKDGYFEFIKDSNGLINHRLFKGD